MELFKILGEIAIDNGKANRAIGETGDHASRMASTMGTAFNKVGKFAAAAGKAIAQGLAVGTVAMGKLVTSAVKSYAEYEQLVGGVETLFGAGGKSLEEYAKSVGKSVDKASAEYNKLLEAENTVMNNASQAYKTAGMSANEYMETVTSFSAALVSSMKGDTVAAAQVADMAIRDMSDNANKMGTDIGAIQNAYQGFAKGNYTMLDNLKLGYGGTQSEMKRLLKEAQKISGVKYDINNLADVYNAIHVIQEEMGITGTTAAEAEKTISGSLASMKASWQNLLNGIAGAGDLSELTANFVKSSKTFIGNIKKIMPSVIQGVNGLIQGLIPEIPGMLESILPGLMEGAASLFGGLAAALPDLVGIIINALPSTMNTLLSAFEPVLGKTLTGLLRGVGTTMANVISGVHKLITGEVKTVDASLSTSTGRWAADMKQALTDMENLISKETARKGLADEYLKTIEALEGKEVKTDEDISAMQDATAALVNLYPQLEQFLSAETGLFTTNAAAIRDNVNALHELAVAQAMQSYEQTFKEGVTKNTELQLESKARENEYQKEAEAYQKQAEVAKKAKEELEAVGVGEKLSVASSDWIKDQGMENLFQWDLDGKAYVNDVHEFSAALNDLGMTYGKLTGEAETYAHFAESERNEQGRLNNEMLKAGEDFLAMYQTITEEQNGFTKESATTFAAYAQSISQYGELSQTAKEAWAEALIVMGTPPDEAAIIAGLNKVEEEADKTTESVNEVQEAAGPAVEAAGTMEEAANTANEAATAATDSVETMFSTTPSTSGVESAAASVNSALDGVIAKAREAAFALASAFGGRGKVGGGNGSGASGANVAIFGDSGGLPGHKTGLDFVPRDNYLARLHQGEAVLTAEEARAWRKGLHGKNEFNQEETIITGNNFYIQQESDIYDLAVELSSLRRESRRGKGARG